MKKNALEHVVEHSTVRAEDQVAARKVLAEMRLERARLKEALRRLVDAAQVYAPGHFTVKEGEELNLAIALARKEIER